MGGNNRNKKPAGKASTSKKAGNGAAKEVNDGPKKKKFGGTELFLIIFGAVALVAIVASIIIGVVASSGSGKRVDYMNDNLSKYIYISPDDYRNITGSIAAVDPVTDLDVEQEILSLLCENKGSVKYDGRYVKNQTVTVGDIVYIYYRGYTENDGGSRNYFDGGCNFSSSDPSELEIGAGSFVPGFELNMIGKNPKDYSTFTKYDTTGAIGEGDRIYISYSRTDTAGGSISGTAILDLSLGKDAIDTEWDIGFYNGILSGSYGRKFSFDAYGDYDSTYTVTAYRVVEGNELIQLTYSAYCFDGTIAQGKTAIIDLSDPDIDKKYGEGFAEFFATGVPVGTKASIVDPDTGNNTTLKTTVGENEQNAYYDMTVNAVYEVGDNPMTVDAYFPADYNEESLQGKWAKFDVYIMKSQEYDAPVYDDAFITDTLKYTAENLAEYEGSTMAQKHTAMIRAELVAEYEEAVNTAIDDLIFNTLTEKAEIKSLPKLDVRDYYDSYYNSINSQFSSSYSSYYETVDAFARDYLGLSSNADWKAELESMAENAVTQKLVFYYVMREEGFIVPDAEYEDRKAELIEDYLKSTLENAKVKRADYDTEEKYLEKVEEYRQNILNYYTEDALRETVRYEYALERMRNFVTVTEE
ncbi:MAG: hypothetical protein IJW48_00230 [Clostridia bacterium]|nr:hypothetical protein [Clostridia bacterium]